VTCQGAWLLLPTIATRSDLPRDYSLQITYGDARQDSGSQERALRRVSSIVSSNPLRAHGCDENRATTLKTMTLSE
jgi:hypothetical protein